VPAVASAGLVLRHEGAFDTPFEPAGKRAAIRALFIRTPARVRLTIPQLEAGRNGARFLLATQTAALASVFIEDSGEEALPIGGFDGAAPSSTLDQLKADIRASQFPPGTGRSEPRSPAAVDCGTLPQAAIFRGVAE